MSNMVQSFPVVVENMSHQENLKNSVPTVKNHTLLDDGIDVENESKSPVGNRKRVF